MVDPKLLSVFALSLIVFEISSKIVLCIIDYLAIGQAIGQTIKPVYTERGKKLWLLAGVGLSLEVVTQTILTVC